MKKTKIDWWGCTVNPIVGCPNGHIICKSFENENRIRVQVVKKF